MRLYSLLQSFVTYANTQCHLEPLLPQFEKAVCFIFQDECYSLNISREKIELINGAVGTEELVCFQETDLRLLITGQVRLQSLLRRNAITYKGTYRTMLLLESVFHICKPLRVGA
ncbi:hypothetical protein M3215_09490 [Bacillus cytotoxicus]|uniref:Uncharacterized protein n=1 Tax=Bacillus cytotoxicus TaxID=580165 RepID=A0ACC6A571_9BACI|nr:hypothetical protein [Bacillus cytotoxicus]